MKKVHKISLSLAGLLLMGATACENTADPAPQGELLSGTTGKTWKVVSIRKDGSDRFQSSCRADNLYTFAAGNAFTLDEGAKKCNTTDPQQLTGTWSLSNSVISVKQGSRSYLYLEVKSLTATRLVVTNDMDGEMVETTFEAQ
jgi:hypothetical protein